MVHYFPYTAIQLTPVPFYLKSHPFFTTLQCLLHHKSSNYICGFVSGLYSFGLFVSLHCRHTSLIIVALY